MTLRELIKALGQAKAARALGIAPAHVSMFVNGKRALTMETLYRAIDAFGEALTLEDTIREEKERRDASQMARAANG